MQTLVYIYLLTNLSYENLYNFHLFMFVYL